MTYHATVPKKDNYIYTLVFIISILFFAMLGTFYKLQTTSSEKELLQTKVQQNQFILPPAKTQKTIYICTSKFTALYYIKTLGAKDKYIEDLNKFSKHLSSIGFKTKLIPLSSIQTLDKNSIVFILDAISISNENKDNIKNFLQNGGRVFFNFTSGFNTEDGKYLGEDFVKSITNLELSHRGYAKFKDGLSITLRLLSPLAKYLTDGKLIYTSVYDNLPLYKTTKKCDVFASSYNQATPPTSKNLQDSIKTNESGIMWHGYYKKGKWIYTSLPSYSFYDVKESSENLKKLLAGAIEFLSNDIVTKVYPFIDKKAITFISEDTEYKYQNFKKFANEAKKYQIPVTAFIVAGIATKNEENTILTKKISKNPYVEFASHSTTHQKIVGESEKFIINETRNSKIVLDKFASSPLIGFRPPREELNSLMVKHLELSGYHYILGATKDHLYPKFDKKYPKILQIPRHGTDDYSFLVNLDWSQREILKQMIKELKFITALNGIYTMSMHTHLFAYKSNIKIVDNFFKYLKKHPSYQVLNGKEILKRVVEKRGILSTFDNTTSTLTIINKNPIPIKNLHILVEKNPSLRLKNIKSTSKEMIFFKKDSLIFSKLPPNSKTIVKLNFGE